MTLLDEVVARMAVNGRQAAVGGFASQPPLVLAALELRDRAAAGPVDDELLELVERFVDGRRKMPGGDCWNCQAVLFAYSDETWVYCTYCAVAVDVAMNRRAALNEAHDRRLSAADVEKESPKYGILIKASRVRTWAWRGRLESTDGLYSLADVLRLAEDRG